MTLIDSKLSFFENFLYSSAISLNLSSLYSTKSILLIAITTCLIPNNETIKECRFVWVATPWRASIKIMAKSAVDAPVVMFLVYCS